LILILKRKFIEISIMKSFYSGSEWGLDKLAGIDWSTDVVVNWLLWDDHLRLDDWLDVLGHLSGSDGLSDCGLLSWVLDDLLDGLIFGSFLESVLWVIFGEAFLDWGIVDIFIGIDVGNVLGLMFNDLIVGVSNFSWDVLDVGSGFIFNPDSFVGNIFHSGFSSNWSSLSASGVNGS
jgi:hypothetical protein